MLAITSFALSVVGLGVAVYTLNLVIRDWKQES